MAPLPPPTTASMTSAYTNGVRAPAERAVVPTAGAPTATLRHAAHEASLKATRLPRPPPSRADIPEAPTRRHYYYRSAGGTSAAM